MFKKLLAFIALAWVGWGCYCLSQPDLQPVFVNSKSPALLWHTASPMQLGTLITDSHATARVLLRNLGGQPLLIHKVEASCGCTVPTLHKTLLQPSEHTWIDVNIDTSLKLGDMKKTLTVWSNDPTHRQEELILLATVVASNQPKVLQQTHPAINPKNRLALFEGSCRSCHVDKGVGKSGQALYLADCGMCHGAKAEGGVAPALNKTNYNDPLVREAMKRIIANGSPTSPSMPPFSNQHGGPLSEAQIESLLNYLAYQASNTP